MPDALPVSQHRIVMPHRRSQWIGSALPFDHGLSHAAEEIQFVDDVTETVWHASKLLLPPPVLIP